MIRRSWTGPVLLLLGAAGLLLSWWIEGSGDVVYPLAVLCLVAVAVGALLSAPAAGEVAVRITGGLLFAAGLAIVVTHHQVWWWLPDSWTTPFTVVAPVVSLTGLAVLLFAYGFRLAWLSGALGLFALVCLALNLRPYAGSDEEAVLRAVATAFGAVALTTGVLVVRPARRWVAPSVAVAVATVVYAGYDAYDHTYTNGQRATVLTATVLGAAAALVAGSVPWWRRRPAPPADPSPAAANAGPGAGGAPDRPDGSAPDLGGEPLARVDTSERRPGPGAAAEGGGGPTLSAGAGAASVSRTGVVAAADSAPEVVAAADPAAGVVAAAGAGGAPSTLVGRLQTAAMVVGLVTGVITIVKELVAAVLAVVP